METELYSKLRRGRRLLLLAIGLTLLGDGTIILLKIAQLGFAASGGSMVRWLLEAALLGAVWQGRNWARWLLVGLYGLALAMTIDSRLFSGLSLQTFLAVQFGFTIVVLAFSPSVSVFLATQRAKYETY
jgi:hypothetical protein